MRAFFPNLYILVLSSNRKRLCWRAERRVRKLIEVSFIDEGVFVGVTDFTGLDNKAKYPPHAKAEGIAYAPGPGVAGPILFADIGAPILGEGARCQ